MAYRSGNPLGFGLKGCCYIVVGTWVFYYAAGWYITDARREELKLKVKKESWEARRSRIFNEDEKQE